MDATNTTDRNYKAEHIMFSDTTSKTSTEDDDSSGDESSTERGYRNCIQKYSKYLPGGEIATQEIIRKRSGDEHDDIISKDDDGSGDTIERYKQFLSKNMKAAPDEGDDQPLEIIIKSESKDTKDMLLEADEDFHRWETPDASKDKTPKLTSNVLASEDLDFVNNLLGADSDSDEVNDIMVRQDGNDQSADIAHTLAETSRGAGLTSSSNVLGNEDMEMVDVMLGSDADSTEDDEEKIFRASYPDLMFNNEDDDDDGKDIAPKIANRGMFDDDIEESHRIFIAQEHNEIEESHRIFIAQEHNEIEESHRIFIAQEHNEIEESHRIFIAQENSHTEEAEDIPGSQTHRRGNTTVGYMSDPSVTEESLAGLSGRSDRGTSFYPHSDSGESSIMTSDTAMSISPIPTTKPLVPKPNINALQEEGLKPIVEREGSSPKGPQNPVSDVSKGTPMNPNSDSGESSIMTTSDDSAMSISPTPITKPPVLKHNINAFPQEGLTPIEEGATLKSSPNLDEEDSIPQLVDDPWNRWVERRDIRIDHMDNDFLCIFSKPALLPMNNVIGNASFSEDETIQSLVNASTPITPVTPDEFLLGSDDENFLESKLLAAGNQVKQPNLNLQTRHIQGMVQHRQGSSPDIIKSNTREINPRDGSIPSKNYNDQTADSRYKSSDPTYESQKLNSIRRSEDTGATFGQGSPTNNQHPSEGVDGYSSQSRSIGGPQHEQVPYTETASMGTSPSVTMRASGAGSSRVDHSSDFTHSVVSSNGWESTRSSSVSEPYEDIENPGIDSYDDDDDGPPHLFSDDEFSFDDERDPLTASRNSEVLGSSGRQRAAPRSSEITVVRGSRTKKKDTDALVRERHEIAIGRTSGNSEPKRRHSLAPEERGLSERNRQIVMVLLVSFLLGAGTFWYIWETYLIDDPEVQADQFPVPSPVVQPTPPPSALVTVRRTETPSWSPSIAQTQTPVEALRDLLIFAWPGLESDFTDSASPQSKALLWLQNSPNIDSYDFQQKIQRFALATFFYSTNGAGWINKGSWLSEADECEWNLSNSFRPPCNEEGIYVYLEMNSNGVSGSIPPQLALLSNSLVRLELSQIGSGTSVISGTIPPELGTLTLLQSIDLANNALTGELPNEIGQWTKATAIDISGNALSSQLPPTIAGLTALRSLNLKGNSFTLLPRQIGDLLSLRNLDVSYNRLGNIPVEIGGLLSLRTLDISHNQIQSSIPSEIGLLSLRNLDISHNQIQSSIPSELGRQSGLVYLDLSNNRLSGSIPPEISRATLLRNLALHNNELIGTIPASLGALSRLATFRVEANNLTGIISQSICNVFQESVPAFVSDCVVELDCPCCMFCCEDPGACQCNLEGELEFLCDEYTTTFGISSLGLN